MTPEKSAPKYFFSLDVIRGFAALIVVLCHWQFYFYNNDTLQTIPMREMGLPLFSYLSAIYYHANFAVDLFFLLSGFIFFWFYADRVADRSITFDYFASYRLTRLYPTHIITLFAIAILQGIMININGHPFIVQNNDLWHFVLNLFVIHSWGFEKTPALNGFNGPSWSVSVEMLLYLLFFIIARRRLQNNIRLLTWMVIAGAVLQYFYSMVGQGIYSFYLGALTYHLYRWLFRKEHVRRIAVTVVVVAVLAWITALTEYVFSYLRNTSMYLLHELMPGWSADKDTAIFNLARNTYIRTIVSPTTVLALAFSETVWGSIKIRWAQVLGNASYALYLLHFPLMVLTLVIVDVAGISRSVFHSPLMLLLFYSVLIPLSIIVHYYFELPVQELFRRRLPRKAAPGLVPVPNNKVIT
ncbi:acyltransferase family protein [Chitinophaga tropicalis]|uniref:Acyltransferase family protein n=1 Tax=Chitinophaga tropicalis TaxID=2683588 RepID=A0A7K1U8K0_9BACT|nr:acyltransferase [Chitinophaga tropicalis]MVT10610.1 acyltransferase family protein [Chitinophaga tropicalis]